MEDILEENEIQRNNKKEDKEKLSNENVFHDLRLNNDNIDNIHSKIDKIDKDQINDLKLINISFTPKHFIASKKSGSSRFLNVIHSFSNNLNENCNRKKNYFKNNKIINRKKEIKLFPYINIPMSNKNIINQKINLTEDIQETSKNLAQQKSTKFLRYKSKIFISLNDEIKHKMMNKNKINNYNNINEEKIFMTKIDSNKNKNLIKNMKSYSQNFYNLFPQKNKLYSFSNKTFYRNDNNNNNKMLGLKEKNNKFYSPTKIFSDNNIKTEKKENEYKVMNLTNKFININNSENNLEEEDSKIYKLLKKNERLSDFLNKKLEEKRNKTSNKKKNKKKSRVSNNFEEIYSSSSKRLSKNYSNNTIKKNIILNKYEEIYSPLNKKMSIKSKNNSSNNNYYININVTNEKNEEQEESKEKVEKIETEKDKINILENQIKTLYSNFPKISKLEKNFKNHLINLNNNSCTIFKKNNNIIEDYDKEFNISQNNKNSPSFNEVFELFKDQKIKKTFLNNLKDKQKLKRFLFYLKANKLLSNFNKDFKDIKYKIKDEKIDLIKEKTKYKNILDKLDKKNNFNLDIYVKDFEKKEMTMNFFQFFQYLLMTVKNYDKKIINNTFEIKKESKEQPLDVKYTTVRKKHDEFMDLLEKQFNEGKNMDHLLKQCLLKRKEEKDINFLYSPINERIKNQTKYNKKFFVKK